MERLPEVGFVSLVVAPWLSDATLAEQHLTSSVLGGTSGLVRPYHHSIDCTLERMESSVETPSFDSSMM